jgi:hypothetical protein
MSFPPPPPQPAPSKTRPSIITKYATYLIVTSIISIILAVVDFFIWDPPANYIIGAIFILVGVFFLLAAFAFFAGQSWALTLSGYSNRDWAQTPEVRDFFNLPQINNSYFQAAPTAIVPPPPSQSICPTCGQPLTYIQQYNRCYCTAEKKYV